MDTGYLEYEELTLYMRAATCTFPFELRVSVFPPYFSSSSREAGGFGGVCASVVIAVQDSTKGIFSSGEVKTPEPGKQIMRGRCWETKGSGLR